ncbi:hypothetical protein ABZ519_28110 [Streptomyces collinus]|uniref:hypothetical protein n=1 Tax=Streptomyces TaxID=1883 RepID=UPI0033F469AD
MTTTADPAAEPGPGEERAAALARIVGQALARPAEGLTPADAAEIQAITDAMIRLLIGAPLRSDGKLTIVALAAEAALRRKLTHKHTGLKDLFNALVKSVQAVPGQSGDAEPPGYGFLSMPRDHERGEIESHRPPRPSSQPPHGVESPLDTVHRHCCACAPSVALSAPPRSCH